MEEKREVKAIKKYNKLIDFLEDNIINNKSLCFGVVYENLKNKQISEQDFIYIITNYFI